MSSDALQDFAFAFLSILFEGAPFILLGTLISGIIDVYLPSGLMDRWLPKKAGPAVLLAGVLGAIFPVCECAVVPVIRRLVRKGLPVSSAITYMLAAPIVNPVTALSTLKAFSGQGAWLMTSSRLLLGYAVAVAVGLIVAKLPLHRVLRKRVLDSLPPAAPAAAAVHDHDHDHGETGCCGGDHDHGHPSDQNGENRLVMAMRSAMRDFVDVGAYFTIGVAITALFNTGIAPGAEQLDLVATNVWGAPAALMLFAFVLSLCSTSDAFIAATLAKFTYGAKLAFLVFGPMMDVKLLFLYQTVMTRRFIAALAVGLFLVIGLACVAWQELLISALR